MRIKLNELKKIAASPVIIGLLIIFIGFNFFIIFKNSYCRNELRILNSIVNKFGYRIDNTALKKFGSYYDHNLKKMNNITYKKASKTYESASQLFNYLNSEDNVYSNNDMKFFKELYIEESYYFNAKSIDSIYEGINPMQIAEYEIKKYNLTGKAAETVRSEYKSFNKRFQELIKNREHKNFFFIGKIYKMHSLLFKSLFGSFIFEIIILVVLTTGYLINYEFENNTQLLAYSSKRGRSLIKDKFSAALCGNLIAATIIMSTGLIAYFCTFKYSGLWEVPISSYFVSERNMYMSKWNMTFVQYLVLSIIIIYILTFIFTGITFCIARYIKNNYVVFFIFTIVFALALLIPGYIPTNSNAIFIAGFTPFVLSTNSCRWFMESGAFTTFKYYEVITALVWTSIIIILNILFIRSFRKIDIF